MKTKFIFTMLCSLLIFGANAQFKALKESVSKEINTAKAENSEKSEAQLWREAYFSGRPETAGPEVESFKENPPVKKESFTAKLERFKNEGFKVAVILSSAPTTTKPPTSGGTMDSKQITLAGSLPSMQEDFVPLLESFTAKMNETFGTDIFENVDIKTIPYREVQMGKVDDWEVTKYRMVLTYSITPQYNYQGTGNMTGDGKYEATFEVSLNVVGVEYVNEKKGVKMRYPIRTGNLGFYKSGRYETEENPGINSVEELHALVKPISGSELVAELQKLQDEKMTKFIEKRKK